MGKIYNYTIFNNNNSISAGLCTNVKTSFSDNRKVISFTDVGTGDKHCVYDCYIFLSKIKK